MAATEHAAGIPPEPLVLAAFAGSPLPIVTLDQQRVVTGWNVAAERLFGWSHDEVVGQVLPMVPADQREEFLTLYQHVLHGERVTDRDVRGTRSDGSLLDLSLSLAPLYDDSGTLRGAMAIYLDITERKRLEAALRQQAYHDPLTQLPNRVLLQDRLEQLLHRAQRQRSSFALLLIDLDRFKAVNDTFGHQMGDRLLLEVAGRIQGVLRQSDTVARLGGDEFVVLLPEVDEEGAREVARKISQALRRPFDLEGYVVQVEPSIGMSLYPTHGEDGPTLLQHADRAMYQAKRSRIASRSLTLEQEERSISGSGSSWHIEGPAVGAPHAADLE